MFCVVSQIVLKFIFYILFVVNKHTENHTARILCYVILCVDLGMDLMCTVEDIRFNHSELV